MMLLLLSVLLASAQDAPPIEVVSQPMGDFWAALMGGGGGAITAGSAAFWMLKRVVGTIVDEKCAGMQATVDTMRTRVQAIEEAAAAPTAPAAAVATLRAEHGVLLSRLREDFDDAKRNTRRENRAIREEVAQRLDRLADRIEAPKR